MTGVKGEVRLLWPLVTDNKPISHTYFLPAGRAASSLTVQTMVGVLQNTAALFYYQPNLHLKT